MPNGRIDNQGRMAEPGISDRMAVVRDPIWNTIRLDAVALRIIESAPFQRLRYIRQLGHAHLVYPGATHTRFDHALGVYHLVRRAIGLLAEQGDLDAIPMTDRRLAELAALLHDIGHYPYSHALEELEPSRIPGEHESLAARFLDDPDIAAALGGLASDGAERVAELIRGDSANPLQGLVSGSLDLDKIEYLVRDARFCGVPYGQVDVDRLLNNLIIVRDPENAVLEMGVHEKGVAALESLLFSKYQMFRNVYWHHAVRAATVLYKRIITDALAGGLIEADELVGQTDDRLLSLLEVRAERDMTRRGKVAGWIQDLRGRRLPKRACEVVASDLDERGVADWVVNDSPLRRAVEDRIAGELNLESGGVYLDYPEKRAMFGLNLPVFLRSGRVVRLGPRGRAGLIRLPQLADELYQTARVLRLFTHGGRHRVDPAGLVGLAAMPEDKVAERLESATPLLG